MFVHSRSKVACKLGALIKVSEEAFKGCGEGSDTASSVLKLRCLSATEDKLHAILGSC